MKHLWLNATWSRKVYNRPGDRSVLGQRRRQLTGIQPAMGCKAGPTLNQNLVGRPTSSLRVLNEHWPSPPMVVEGIHVEDIFELVSLVLSLIISWTFMILAHEDDQYSDFFYCTQTD